MAGFFLAFTCVVRSQVDSCVTQSGRSEELISVTNHYYSQNPEVGSDPQHFTFDLRGRSFRFKTDHGVFSKKEVDFGSRVLIDAFELPGVDGPVLDVGCGYGPIGIALAGFYTDRQVVMSDINERAIALAKQNALDNNIKNAVFVKSDRFNNLKGRKFASIISNPPIRAGKKVVHQMFEESQQALVDAGSFWIVIQKKQGAPSAKKKLETLFPAVEIVARNKGYYIFKAIKI